MHNRSGTLRHGAFLLGAGLLLSCNSDERIQDDGGPLDWNDPDDSKLCEQRRTDYRAFLDKHHACESDDDCAVVGDCGPHAGFDPVRADSWKEATQLRERLCEWAFDGATFDPICRASKCELRMRTDRCCGCPPDAGD